MSDEQQAYHELCAYTLTHGHPDFIHQHVVDAWAVQQATADSKRIGVAFPLFGLYLRVEKGWTGRAVQRAHVELARRSKTWPAFDLPVGRGGMTASDVMREPEGPARDAAIDRWCASVWQACQSCRDEVIALLDRHGILPRGC